jgi:glyoxylase-like metal-dependent hydrolase (beta-lactamase superfamily II)
LLIVDDQYAPLAEKIEAAMAKLGPRRLKYVLNTHFHGDHTGGNVHFGRQATIIAQANVRKRLSGVINVQGGLPVVTFDSNLSVHFNEEEIKLVHLGPGHTDGDTIVVFTKANVVHAGDQFFSGRFPNIDLAGGGDVRGYIRNVGQLLEMLPAGARVIPGHGPLSSRKELEEFYEMLKATAGLVEQAIGAGKTLEQVKAEGLPERWKKWEAPTLSAGRWLEILYRGLSPK